MLGAADDDNGENRKVNKSNCKDELVAGTRVSSTLV